MAEGYSDIPHSTYEIWKTNTLGHEYDLDGSYGCQCWDYASLFWRNVGFPVGYPLTGDLHYAYQCWTASRVQNAGDTFDLIYAIADVKQGDVIVLNGNSQNPPGHIAFADEDYDGSGYLWCIGQNQGGTPSPSGGTAVTRNHLGMSLFLGAFRYKDWHTTPPTIRSKPKSTNFKWVLYARKLRDKR